MYIDTAVTIFTIYLGRAHTFHMPEDTTVPIIMVGPGTGLAPFRSFWQQRQYDITKKGHYGRMDSGVSEASPQQPDLNTATVKCLSPAVNKLGSMSLFFGCRNSKQDCIHKDEMLKAKDEGALTEIFFAFSREPDAPKVRVDWVNPAWPGWFVFSNHPAPDEWIHNCWILHKWVV